MNNQIVIECKSAEDADILRDALRRVSGVDVEDEILAKSMANDYRKIVSVAVVSATMTACLLAIVDRLTSLGYNDICINGKVVVLSVFSIEGAIQAKTDGQHSNNATKQENEPSPNRGADR